jgi:hypothetical protein
VAPKVAGSSLIGNPPICRQNPKGGLGVRPIEVRGYTRPFEGQVTASLLDRKRDVLASKTVRTNDWTSAWGRFGATLEFSGYEGLATLRVGSRSPRDGAFVGTETEVFLQSSGPG